MVMKKRTGSFRFTQWQPPKTLLQLEVAAENIDSLNTASLLSHCHGYSDMIIRYMRRHNIKKLEVD